MNVELSEQDIIGIHSALTARLVQATQTVLDAKRDGVSEEMMGTLGRMLHRRSALLQHFEEASGYRPTTMAVE